MAISTLFLEDRRGEEGDSTLLLDGFFEDWMGPSAWMGRYDFRDGDEDDWGGPLDDLDTLDLCLRGDEDTLVWEAGRLGEGSSELLGSESIHQGSEDILARHWIQRNSKVGVSSIEEIELFPLQCYKETSKSE